MKLEAREPRLSPYQACALSLDLSQARPDQVRDSFHAGGTLGEPFFDMFCLKVSPCMRSDPHDWCACAFNHPGEKAARRDPRKISYTGIACEDMKKEGRCALGDRCPYAHSAWEYWLHPSRYHTQTCKHGDSCSRKSCFFAHRQQEVIHPLIRPQVHPDTAQLCNSMALALASTSDTSQSMSAASSESPCLEEGALKHSQPPSVSLPPRHVAHSSPSTARAATSRYRAMPGARSCLNPAIPMALSAPVRLGSGAASLYSKDMLYSGCTAWSSSLSSNGMEQLCSAPSAQSSLTPSRAPSADDILSALLIMAGQTPQQPLPGAPQELLLQGHEDAQHVLGVDGLGKEELLGKDAAVSSFLTASLMASSGLHPSVAAHTYSAPATCMLGREGHGFLQIGTSLDCNLLPPRGFKSLVNLCGLQTCPKRPHPLCLPPQSNWDHHRI